jgi:hypothetical protein
MNNSDFQTSETILILNPFGSRFEGIFEDFPELL